MATKEKFNIGNDADAGMLWHSSGNEFEGLDQAIEELIDDAYSNFEGNQCVSRTVVVSIEEIDENNVKVSVEDSGTGMKRDNLGKIFSMADTSVSCSALNEHGCGLKHAMSFANRTNDNWLVATRTDDMLEKGQYVIIDAPYCFGKEARVVDDAWPGMLKGTGTYIEFSCTKSLFNTITHDKRVKDFNTTADRLYEELGYRYSQILAQAKMTLVFKLITKSESKVVNVGPVQPCWECYAKSAKIRDLKGKIYIDLTTGKTYKTYRKKCVLIEYCFGRMMKHEGVRTPFDNSIPIKHYIPSMSCSGVELRLNGRVIESGIIQEIWDVLHHPSHNKFLATVNIVTCEDSVVPMTRTSKTGFSKGTNELDNLYEWIQKMVPDIKISKDGPETERQAFRRISEVRAKTLSVSTTEQHCFTSVKGLNGLEQVRIDMYECSDAGVITIYEGKIGTCSVADVRQLQMYWDGLVYDGIKPDKALLVAERHPESVKSMVCVMNTFKDQAGNSYNFDICSWDDL